MSPLLNRLFITISNLVVLRDNITHDEIPPIDFFIPLMSIPHILETTIDRIPNQIPYLFPVSKNNRQELEWGGLKIGFAWASGRHSIEFGEFSYLQKSTKLENFLTILSFPDLRLFSLQVDESAQELELYKNDARLIDCRPFIKDFYDTATIILNLDLIITVDTSLAHLAGALGKPVWVLLPFSVDWRWLIDRCDSPWYPTMKLFRQKEINDWQSVFQEVLQEIRTFPYSPV